VKPETQAALARIARRHAKRYHRESNSKSIYSFEKAMNAMLLDAYLAGAPQSFRGVLETEFKRRLIELVRA